MTAVFITREE